MSLSNLRFSLIFIDQATMDIEEIYKYDKKSIAKSIYGTLDTYHPGVTNINKLKDFLIAGKINLIEYKQRTYDN